MMENKKCLATWSSGRCPCSWHGGWNQMIFKVPSLPFYDSKYCLALLSMLESVYMLETC